MNAEDAVQLQKQGAEAYNPRLLVRSRRYGGSASTGNISSAALGLQAVAVPTVRFELTRAVAQRLARLVRLPIPPRGHS